MRCNAAVAGIVSLVSFIYRAVAAHNYLDPNKSLKKTLPGARSNFFSRAFTSAAAAAKLPATEFRDAPFERRYRLYARE